jgi:hypothetical protein
VLWIAQNNIPIIPLLGLMGKYFSLVIGYWSLVIGESAGAPLRDRPLVIASSVIANGKLVNC